MLCFGGELVGGEVVPWWRNFLVAQVSQSLLLNIHAVTDPSRLRCDKKIKMFKKKKQVDFKTYYYQTLYLVQYTTFVCNKKTFYPLISEFTLPLDCVEVDLWEKF